jgi:hypothetical protein
MDKRVGDEAPFIAAHVRTERRNPELARQILPSSGTMIAMCTTMVGLVKVAEGRLGATYVDVYAAMLGAAFLTSAVLAYVAIRSARYATLSARCERAADALFIASLAASVFVVALFAFEAI